MAKKISTTILCLLLTFGLIMSGQTAQLADAVTSKSKVISIKPLSITVNQGQNVVLPKTVPAKTSKGTVNIAVIWKVGKINTSKVGKIKINGTVKDYSKSVELTINVEKYILSIENINISINQNEKLELPQMIPVKYSDNSIGECSIRWIVGNADTSKVKTFSFQGTVKGYNNKVLATVKVNKYITNIDNLDVIIKHNDKFEMPQTVKVKMSDGTEENKSIVWNSNLDTSVIGKVTIEGVVDGYNSKVALNATVNSYLKTVNNVEVTVIQEDKFAFPQKIKGIMSDNVEVDVPVKWNSENLDTNQVSKNTYVGTVDGFTEKVYLTVTVKSNKLTVKEISEFKNAIVAIRTYDHHGYWDGSGSGFVISPDGIVVTCYHVIDGNQSGKVVFEDGTRFEIEGVLGYSKDKDIAIIKLKDAHNLPCVKLGDSDKVAIGDEIVAIGNPLGLVNTVSSGNVSGLNRVIDGKQGNIMQLTAGVQHGSSGGALFNMKGEVVGITNAIMETTGNLNFAIPIKEIQPFLSITEKKAMAELNPLNDDQKYELELEKKFSGTQFNGVTVNASSIYIEKESYGIDVYIYYDDDICESFNKNIYNSGISSIARLAYMTYARNIYDELKNHYKTQDITIIIKGYQSFKVKPNESEFDKATYDSATGIWDASITFAACGDDDNGYIFLWRPIK